MGATPIGVWKEIMIEDTIRHIVAEELERFRIELTEELRRVQEARTVVDQYGETLTVAAAAEVLHVSKSTIYEMAHNPAFPRKQIGRRTLIPTRRFFEWLNDTD